MIRLLYIVNHHTYFRCNISSIERDVSGIRVAILFSVVEYTKIRLLSKKVVAHRCSYILTSSLIGQSPAANDRRVYTYFLAICRQPIHITSPQSVPHSIGLVPHLSKEFLKLQYILLAHIPCPIQSALCLIESKRFVNYNTYY